MKIKRFILGCGFSLYSWKLGMRRRHLIASARRRLASQLRAPRSKSGVVGANRGQMHRVTSHRLAGCSDGCFNVTRSTVSQSMTRREKWLITGLVIRGWRRSLCSLHSPPRFKQRSCLF